jgi:2-keto-4-pentenoate hydratase
MLDGNRITSASRVLVDHWRAGKLCELGIILRAGEVVTTGTCHPLLPIQAGGHLAADFARRGRCR